MAGDFDLFTVICLPGDAEGYIRHRAACILADTSVILLLIGYICALHVLNHKGIRTCGKGLPFRRCGIRLKRVFPCHEFFVVSVFVICHFKSSLLS